MKNITKLGVVSALSLIVGASASFAETIKIAFIDPLSGPFASTGTNGLHQFEFAADYMVNQKGGVLDGDTFEVVGFDNKISPKESLIQLQVAIDQGIRYIVQGNSSGVANAPKCPGPTQPPKAHRMKTTSLCISRGPFWPLRQFHKL